jgi:KDO2-lipid IV(A) lauroyltransferase
VPRFFEKIAFELLYPLYLIKFREEKKYIAARLKKANLKILPKDVYKNLFLNGLASLHFLQNKKVPVMHENLNLMQAEINKGNPVVFASIHFGAFEILHRGLGQIVGAKNFSPLQLVVSEFKNKKLDKFLTKIRTTSKVKTVKDYEVSKILKNIIRNREILAVMADQAKQGAEYFQILGDSVPLFFKLPLMANRLGASLVFFRTFRKDDVHVIRFERVYSPKSEIDKNEIAKMIESWILEYPEQWAWNYNSR